MTQLVTPETEKSLSLPIGVVSPLWLMFGAAAVTGAAMFWARQWFQPTNLEASLNPRPLPPVAPAAVETVAPVLEAVEETLESAVEQVEETAAETVAFDELAAEPVEAVAEAAPEVVETVADAVEAVADDLTKLTGIGPKLAASLAERGVTRFADIAAWTAADVEAFDKDMKLMGRIDREAWIAQAKRYAETAAH
jgi:predicted flap endonuclease-1-like 5' DNA nuclease